MRGSKKEGGRDGLERIRSMTAGRTEGEEHSALGEE